MKKFYDKYIKNSPIMAAFIILIGFITFYSSGPVYGWYDWSTGNVIGGITILAGFLIFLIYLIPRTKLW